MWEKNGAIERLAERWHVVAFDARGHGQSSKPHDPQSYGLAMIQDIVNIIDAFAAERAAVVGYSMGSTGALKMAAMYPQRVQALVLAGYGLRDAVKWKDRALDTAQRLRSGEGFGELFQMNKPGTQARVRLREDAQKRILMLNDHRALAACIEQSPVLEVGEEEIARIGVQTLCLVGRQDTCVEGAKRLAAILPDAQLETIAGNHFNAPTNDEFAPMIEQFLQDSYDSRHERY